MNPETQQNDLQAQAVQLQKELRQLRQFALGGLVAVAADGAGNRAVVGVSQTPDLNPETDSAASIILKHRDGRKVQVKPPGFSH